MSYFNSLTINLREVLLLQFFLFVLSRTNAQEQEKGLEIYGQVLTDIGYNFDQVDPARFDVSRVTKLPWYKDQFASDGKMYFTVRQTKPGFKSSSQTPRDQFQTTFEFDLFGVRPDVDQTTFRFRMAYAEPGKFMVGQNESTFTDNGVSPGIPDFGAPSSRAFLCTAPACYMHIREHNRWAVALEDTGATPMQPLLQ